MHTSIQNHIICLQPLHQGKFTKEFVVDKWDHSRKQLVQTKIQITIQNQEFMIYSQDGVILRIEKVYDFEKNPEILNNMEQIKNLTWQGLYGLNDKKYGKWIAFWNVLELMDVGGYYKDGLKQGLWRDITKNYQSHIQIFEIGEYQKDLRVGVWKYTDDNNNWIGGGIYDYEGYKKGKWIVLDEQFSKQSEVIYNGEYNIKGQKVGRWDILLNGKQIGGGQYHFSSSNKIGKWIELDQGFYISKQITYSGKYNEHGMKTGRWDIFYNDYLDNNQLKNFKIGGGEYQSGKKIGRWIEVDEQFCKYKQVVYIGDYDMMGMKIGKWCINYKDGDDKEKYKYIGGGSYDNQTGNKTGIWIELDEQFYKYRLVTYTGSYDQNNIKVDRWDIYYNNFQANNQWKKKLIGGGKYKSSSGKKIGLWLELDERFKISLQIFQHGEYNKYGMKIGRWDIFCNNYHVNDCCKNIQIGGGYYDYCLGNKIGRWIELDERFSRIKKITYNGEYDMKGIKIGRWDIFNNGFQANYQLNEKYIGGGSYDSSLGVKFGRWIELDDQFVDYQQYTYEGEYNSKGKKINLWVKMDIKQNKQLKELRYDN
ncbi:unnamed protein product [Paramecium sonneborni]|uniref:Uncharacterized protein n=1 Tax=Paramecium sonneborni TaxID=65129 RepID=A0A8S1NLS9_9CILI|nr:unnamed protein product [Paramecium sonneborni]